MSRRPCDGLRVTGSSTAPYAPPDESLRAAPAGRGAARGRGRSAHRCARPRLVEAIRAQCRRARRDRGFPARLFALDQGGPGADGAGGGAAARAGCRHRRPADRGQACGRRLVASRGRSRTRSWSRPRPGRSASRRASSSRARRRRTSREPGQAARPAGGARRDAAGDAAARLAFRARPDHRGGAVARRRRIASSAIPSTCWARARAPPPMRRAISRPMRTRSTPSARAPATRALAGRGPAFR